MKWMKLSPSYMGDVNETMIRSYSIVLSLSLLLSTVWSQDFSDLFREVESGNLDAVRARIPQLIDQYPRNDAVVFLAALVKERAEEAVIAYKSLIQNYPDSPYADDAITKVGEYLYARGLYTQSSRELGKLPRFYPNSEHLQRVIDLQINSLLAIGETDSAKYYIQSYGARFPSLDFNYDFSSERPLVSRPLGDLAPTPLSEGMKRADASQAVSAPQRSQASSESAVSRPEATVPQSRREPPPSKNTEPPAPAKPFVVQVGAFGARQNALRQVQRLQQSGYDAEVWPVTVKGKNLYAVQVIRFGDRTEAEFTGKKLKRDLGFNYLVIKRPE